ncbi:MAG TPA: NAD(P)H-dependent oxidoreductase subunit E [Gemmatimonadales bacterium]|nr:NAD(P)H-dependent oxidoreductase subunit E [Gemmatimonadales bacterium]
MSAELPTGEVITGPAAPAGPSGARTPLVGGNPGWAGERGEFAHLSEADIRGDSYVGRRPLDGGVGGAVCSMPYELAAKDPDAPLFEGPYAERVQKIIARYPDKQGALLPLLNLAEEVRGYVSPDAMARVAEILGLAPAYVRGVATFYSMYNRQPVGRYLVQVCTNVACNLCGGDEVMEAFLEHLDVEPGVTTADGTFTVMEVECLGACGFPVAVQINSRYFENVTPEDVPAIVAGLTSGEDSSDAADGLGAAAGGEPTGRARPRAGSSPGSGAPADEA